MFKKQSLKFNVTMTIMAFRIIYIAQQPLSLVKADKIDNIV